jgi:hypothetical protein
MYNIKRLNFKTIYKHFSTLEDKIKSIEITQSCIKVNNPFTQES